MKIVFYLHLHQPWRLARFRYLDLGTGKPYFDIDRNLDIFRRIAANCYRPTLDRLETMLRQDSRFRVSFSITGTFLEQAALAAPDVIERIQRLVETGRVALLSETYYHSLAFLLPPPELEEEVALHQQRMEDLFHVRPHVLRMTELVYDDDLARFAAREGFSGMLAEGWEAPLRGRSPNHVYSSVARGVSVVLRNYRLSDDVGFRFSARGWTEYPLTAEKYALWLSRSPGDVVGLFLDFETFGEHHPASTGILDFLSALPSAVAREPNLEWATVEDAVRVPPAGPFVVPEPMSWADEHRDLGAWLGNDMQRSAFDAAKKAGTFARSSHDPEILSDWRKLLTSDHFYYMYVSGKGADADVHRYFSSYSNPYDAYANYMNALNDLRRRSLAKSRASH
ncbi:MAG TPA: glycoside hydrolase family 57 protein [Thermoplasmata archaeon]|nr:glycoside hydrolase family 57 protein [Thermoplasmata archaeon]